MAIDWDAAVLQPLMSQDVFGETVTYTPVGHAAFQINDAVFDDGFLSVEALGPDGPDFSTSNPILGVRLAAFPPGVEPGQNDQVVVASNGKTYLVAQPRPDGKGWARLELMEAAP